MSTRHQPLCCAMAVASFVLVSSGLSAAEEIVHTKDSPATIKQNVAEKKAVLLDVREKDETAEGYVRGARRLPLSQLRSEPSKDDLRERVSEKVPREKIVYTYCRSGRRSLVAGEILRELGYEVRPLKQGFEDLVELGFSAVVPKE